MRWLLPAALAGTLLPALGAAEVYKCEGPDGSVTFSGSPCGASAEKVDVELASGRADPEAAAAARERTSRSRDRRETEQRREAQQEEAASQDDGRSAPGIKDCPSEREIRRAIADNRVLVCMTKAEVAEAEPNRNTQRNENTVLLDSGVSVDEWFYRQRWMDWPKTLWFRDGKVTAIQ